MEQSNSSLVLYSITAEDSLRGVHVDSTWLAGAVEIHVSTALALIIMCGQCDLFFTRTFTRGSSREHTYISRDCTRERRERVHLKNRAYHAGTITLVAVARSSGCFEMPMNRSVIHQYI
jgi:hypothetical protein